MHEAEWARLDRRLRGLARRRAALDAEEASLLRYAEELKLWRAYGFGSLLEYMERAMGYAPHTAAERLRVARALAELPSIAEALERGELAHSAVRELSRVAVPDSEQIWLEAARGKSLREIEAMVVGRRPGDLPTDPTEPRHHRRTITLEVSPETYDIWRKLHALAAEEHGQRLSDDELIVALFRRAYSNDAVDRTSTAVAGAATTDASAAAAGDARAATDASAAAATGNRPAPATDNRSAAAAGRGRTDAGTSFTPSSPAYKIAIKQCPDCGRGWQFTGGRDLEVEPAVLELAACDAGHLGSLDAPSPERATTTVTPRKREQVLARDGHRCTVPGCRRNVGLDLHHIEYQRRGGGHELRNLTTLCDLHHRAVHFGKLAIRGVAPDGLSFEFRKPRDRRNIIDDDRAGPRGVSAGVPARSAASSAFAASIDAARPAERGQPVLHGREREPPSHGEASCAMPAPRTEQPSHGEASCAMPTPRTESGWILIEQPSHEHDLELAARERAAMPTSRTEQPVPRARP